MFSRIIKFAQTVTNSVLDFMTNEKNVLRMLKVGFIFITVLFILLIISTANALYHNQVKQFIGGVVGILLIFISQCMLLVIISQMSQSIKQERLDIKRNDSGEDYIEVSGEHYNSDDRNVYTIGGQNANDYQFTKLSEFVDYIKQNQLKIGKYIIDRQNNTFKKIDIER